MSGDFPKAVDHGQRCVIIVEGEKRSRTIAGRSAVKEWQLAHWEDCLRRLPSHVQRLDPTARVVPRGSMIGSLVGTAVCDVVAI
jgi:hypothetical protein